MRFATKTPPPQETLRVKGVPVEKETKAIDNKIFKNSQSYICFIKDHRHLLSLTDP